MKSPDPFWEKYCYFGVLLNQNGAKYRGPNAIVYTTDEIFFFKHGLYKNFWEYSELSRAPKIVLGIGGPFFWHPDTLGQKCVWKLVVFQRFIISAWILCLFTSPKNRWSWKSRNSEKWIFSNHRKLRQQKLIWIY